MAGCTEREGRRGRLLLGTHDKRTDREVGEYTRYGPNEGSAVSGDHRRWRWARHCRPAQRISTHGCSLTVFPYTGVAPLDAFQPARGCPTSIPPNSTPSSPLAQLLPRARLPPIDHTPPSHTLPQFPSSTILPGTSAGCGPMEDRPHGPVPPLTRFHVWLSLWIDSTPRNRWRDRWRLPKWARDQRWPPAQYVHHRVIGQ